MNKRPLLLRTCLALVVILVFVFSIHPLFQRDYYDTFFSLLKEKDNTVAKDLVARARELQSKDRQLYQSQALLAAADAKGIDMTKMVKGEDLQDNRDVLSLIRKQASSSIRLGLDLNGGVEFLLQLVPDEDFLKNIRIENEKAGANKQNIEEKMTAEFDRYRDIAIEILRKRLEGQKIFEAEIAPSGSSYVALRAPVVTKDEKLKLLNLIKMSAKLRFRLVHQENAALVTQYLADKANFKTPLGYELMTTSEFRPGKEPKVEYFFVETRAQMDGKGVTDAFPSKDEFGQRKILLRFNQSGAADFARVTAENVGRQLAIVLDGKLYCAPSIRQAITGGSAEISGSFSDEECKSISDALVSGSFPFQIKVNAVFDTDPKLGASNVSNGIWVGVVSLALVALFMIVYYRLAGVLAVVALTLNIVLLLGAMAAFDATLTLPGIAGIVLTIGMAVDANVLVFERIREEMQAGKSIKNAVDLGYQRAFSAVFDANLTTLITAFILMNVGTGAVKGFAVTLTIGILTSLFTALFITRLIFDYIFNYGNLTHLNMMQMVKNPKFPFTSVFKKAMTFSLIVIVLSFALFAVRGRKLLGVDFTGGTVVTFNYVKQVPQQEVEKALKKAGFDATVTYKYNAAAASDNAKMEVLVRTDMGTDTTSPKDQIGSFLNATFPDAKLSGGQESSVGGLIGWEFTKYALLAIVLSFIGIGIYVSLRYEFSYALASVLALVHDVIVVMGVFILMGRTVSLTAVAAILTVIGYSINDTVVIFDRIRENVKLQKCADYAKNINLSINQTMSRTLLTSITTFIVVFVLYLAGGIAINDFVLIIMLGVLVGTYSSVFIAAPLVQLWHRKVGRLDRVED